MAGRARTWLGHSTAERCTGVVLADRFERLTWRDTCEQSEGLRELARELGERHDHAADLLADVFLASCKAGLRLRERTEMDPARLVNHQVISALVESPDFASELANLGLPELRAVFAARYAAGQLMLYDSRGEQPTGRGAVIACVDTSHSMYAAGPGGVTREAWSKACALALLDQARHAGRDFVGILFSAEDRIQVFRFPAGRSAGIEQVLDFAETFLGGGTSYQAPLTVARELLEEEFDDATSTRGDIVMITDDECGVTEEWMRGWNDARRVLGFRLFGLAVGAPGAAEAGSVLDALCDNLRSIEDLTDLHAAADLFRLI
ncbi:VWA domain-containing protein [Streptomyces anulatus]|uniref:VWA domain-containing protein n=1 Tax=Streptomyces anulatus TaxID=1892 RepID=UPI0036B76586